LTETWWNHVKEDMINFGLPKNNTQMLNKQRKKINWLTQVNLKIKTA